MRRRNGSVGFHSNLGRWKKTSRPSLLYCQPKHTSGHGPECSSVVSGSPRRSRTSTGSIPKLSSPSPSLGLSTSSGLIPTLFHILPHCSTWCDVHRAYPQDGPEFPSSRPHQRHVKPRVVPPDRVGSAQASQEPERASARLTRRP